VQVQTCCILFNQPATQNSNNNSVLNRKKSDVHLGADLVAALAGLNVDDFTHLVDWYHNAPHELAVTDLRRLCRQRSYGGCYTGPALIWTPSDSVLSNGAFVFVRDTRKLVLGLTVLSVRQSDAAKTKSTLIPRPIHVCCRYVFTKRPFGQKTFSVEMPVLVLKPTEECRWHRASKSVGRAVKRAYGRCEQRLSWQRVNRRDARVGRSVTHGDTFRHVGYVGKTPNRSMTPCCRDSALALPSADHCSWRQTLQATRWIPLCVCLAWYSMHATTQPGNGNRGGKGNTSHVRTHSPEVSQTITALTSNWGKRWNKWLKHLTSCCS